MAQRRTKQFELQTRKYSERKTLHKVCSGTTR